MRLLDRDRIWTFAWAMVPLALAVNAFFGSGYEASMRLAYQAGVDAKADDWSKALTRYRHAARVAPDSAAMAHNVSVSYHELGDHEQALAWNHEALARDADFEAALAARPMLERAARRAPQGAGAR